MSRTASLCTRRASAASARRRPGPREHRRGARSGRARRAFSPQRVGCDLAIPARRGRGVDAGAAGDVRPPHQRGVQRGAGGVEPAMQAVEPTHAGARDAGSSRSWRRRPPRRPRSRCFRRGAGICGDRSSYTCTTRAATTGQSNPAACRRPAAASSDRRRGSASSPSRAAASATGSPAAGRSTPAPPRTAPNASRSDATTGAPAAIASASTMPKLSPPRFGAQNTSIERSARAFVASSTGPSAVTGTPTPASAAGSPGPTTSNRRSGRVRRRRRSASSSTGMPLRGSSKRPEEPDGRARDLRQRLSGGEPADVDAVRDLHGVTAEVLHLHPPRGRRDGDPGGDPLQQRP